MELHILMGRACAGKSRRVLEEITARRSQRGQVLLVPEHASHEAELDLCRACGPTASRDAEVLSFRSLATRVLGRTGGLADVTLDAGGKLLTMRRALQEVSGRLTVFARPSQRPAFLRQLVALADELYAYRVQPETLLRQVEDIPGAAGDKLRSAALVFAAYDARLHGDGFDVRSRVQKLCDALPEDDYLTGKDVYVDGFSYFNRVEEDILATVLRQAHSLTVTLLGDMHEVQLFQNAIGQRYRLERMAAESGAKCEVEHLSPASVPRWAIWNATASAIRRNGRAATCPSGCTRPTRRFPRWSTCRPSCAVWPGRACAGVIWAWPPGTWTCTARCWRRCSAGTASRPISAAAAIFWTSLC